MPRKMVTVKDERLLAWSERYCESHHIQLSGLIEHLLEQHKKACNGSILAPGDQTPGFILDIRRKL